MKLYYNEVRQNQRNTTYPYCAEIHNSDDLLKVVQYDHVCAKYATNHRKISNFIQSDCNMFDVDNSDSDDPNLWVTPDHVRSAFPGVAFFVSYSRNHMKEKSGKSARPKFHVYFPDIVFTDSTEYTKHKKAVCVYFPAFDPNAKDSARFFYGVEQPRVEYYHGEVLLFNFMKDVSLKNAHSESGQHRGQEKIQVIPEGQRNSTLYKFAVRILKRYGDASGEAYQVFRDESVKCSPPLPQAELDNIWESAIGFFRREIKTDPGYIPSDQYNAVQFIPQLKPNDFTDVGEARVFARVYAEKLRYSPATKYLLYTGTVWRESELGAHALAQDLTEQQLQEAKAAIKAARSESSANLENAEKYHKFVLYARDSHHITAMLKEAQPMLEIDPAELDADCYSLNTPSGTVDLRTKQLLPHTPDDYCTKITNANPGTQGADLFGDFLKQITCGDKALEDFLQLVAGMSAIGKVFSENLIIAYGSGKNGKSTFFNLLTKVLGSYSGNLSAETLTANCRKNKSPEYAELRGRRLVIASELEENMQLNTAIVKKLCSTDDVYAEKKYKAPFSYTPSHTVVLCTNHLPKVRTTDCGTWRRLIVVPFNARINGDSDIKNYADYLFERAGGAVLSWLIDGAYKFIMAENKITFPKVVNEAIDKYQEENNWLHRYISERCEVNGAFIENAGELYQDYREYCVTVGEHALSDSDFKRAMEQAGFESRKRNTGRKVFGLRLRQKASNPKVLGNFSFEVTESDDSEQNFSETYVEF